MGKNFGPLNPAKSGMVQIAQVIASGSPTTIVFGAIPNIYSGLTLEYIARSNTAGLIDSLLISFNSDAGSNYYAQKLFATNTSVGASSFAALGGPPTIGQIAGATALAGIGGSGVVEIPGYAQTSFFKTLLSRSVGGNAATTTGAGFLIMDNFGIAWNSLAAIASISLSLSSGPTFTNGSIFTLYGKQ